jgi:hypothetical protein
MRKHVPLVECTRLNSAHSRTLSRCNVDALAQEWMVGYPQVLRVVAACKCLQQLMSVCASVWKGSDSLTSSVSLFERADRPRVRDDICTLSCYHIVSAGWRSVGAMHVLETSTFNCRVRELQDISTGCQALGTRNCVIVHERRGRPQNERALIRSQCPRKINSQTIKR